MQDDGARDLGKPEKRITNVFGNFLVHDDCGQCLPASRETGLVVPCDVDRVIAEQRADAPDHAGHIVVQKNDERTGRDDVDVVLTDANDPGVPFPEKRTGEPEVTPLGLDHDLHVLPVGRMAGDTRAGDGDVSLPGKERCTDEVHLIGSEDVSQQADQSERSQRFERIVGTSGIPYFDLSDAPWCQRAREVPECGAELEERAQSQIGRAHV